MVRGKIKWKFAFFFYTILLNVFTKSLPIDTTQRYIATVDGSYTNFLEHDSTTTQKVIVDGTADEPSVETTRNSSRSPLLRQNLRPGQRVRRYTVDLTINGDTFTGRALIDVQLDANTREDPILFHIEDLTINSVLAGVFTDANVVNVNYEDDDGLLEITPDQVASSYIIIVEYSGQLSNTGAGLFQGNFNDHSYIGMNLHPTNARRVFPCIDEPTEESIISFNFNNVPFNNVVANSQLEENSATILSTYNSLNKMVAEANRGCAMMESTSYRNAEPLTKANYDTWCLRATQFRPLQGPPHLWGMMAHNFPTTIPVAAQNVMVYGRPGMSQDNQASSSAINFFFTALNEWTDKPYFEIVLNQDGRMNIFALPDTSREWYALSTVCIWEPYIYMEPGHAIKQRKTGLVKIAEEMSRQWFGNVIFPENWSNQWVISGLNTYTAYEIMREFQADPLGTDITLLDVNTLFVTEIIQESLLNDAYANAQPLEPAADLFEEMPIRDHINGLLKYKAPAILRMLRLALGGTDTDFIQLGGRALLNTRSLQTVNTLNFYDAINSEWLSSGNNLIGDLEEFVEPWVTKRGYPLVNVDLRLGGVRVSQEHFGFSAPMQESFAIPLTYTTNRDSNYDNIDPVMLLENTIQLSMALGEEDFILFNLQGQGYYRVNYDADLWERIIEALEDRDVRETIHPLNRATLIDDVLNLARAGKETYETAFQVVLAMEHETEYAVWKAFVRNMDFLRKRLVAHVTEDEDLDPDIYLRMVRRTISRFEDEISFYPDPQINEATMISLTRGLVMDHACRANYQPCIAAAVDWFYDPNNNEQVNPNIPNEIRPAVYCTMVREGDFQVLQALTARLEIEESHYERVVILESLGCSRDNSYISSLLDDTITANKFGVEERSKIFAAVAESSYENARLALNFMQRRSSEIINMYGGREKFEEMIFVLARNMANNDLTSDFVIWINSRDDNLDDSIDIATRARDQAIEDLRWDNLYLEDAYEWIDENDAPRIILSLFLICVTFMITLFNH